MAKIGTAAEMIQVIQSAFGNVVLDPSIKIKSVDLTLKVCLSAGIGIGIKLPFVDAEGNIVGDISRTSTINLQFAPPGPPTKKPITPITDKDIKNAIEIIQNAASTALAGKPTLTLDSASIEILFVINEKGEINFLLKGKEIIEATQTLKIEFERNKPT